jgi:nucleoside-diphosphate-sugar epimerase/glycosyltransferase involved in cell wall biosynthesis
MKNPSFWKGQRVLVGGGCGFLGSYLVPQLAEAGSIVTVVDNLDSGHIENIEPLLDVVKFRKADLREPATCHDLSSDQDITINLAAKAFGVEYSRAHNGEMLVYNLLCTLPLLDASRVNAVKRFVIVSSSCVYPDDASVPTPELPAFTREPESVNEGYGWAKRVQELAGTYYARDYGMKISVVRPFNPYGSNYRWTCPEKAHVVPALVKRIMDGEDPLRVWGSGRQRRNLLHASDATRLIMEVVASDAGPMPVNIGFDDDTTIADVVSLICEVSGKHPQVEYDTSKPEGRFRKCADATRLRSLTDYQPQIGLRQGIEEMVHQWYSRSFQSRARDAGKCGDAPDGSLKVSVVIPVRNNARYIGAAIESVIRQSYSNIDILVVDGASTDGTQDIVRSFQSVRMISEPDKCQAEAANKGLARIDGDIVHILCGDDTLDPNAVATVVSTFERTPGIEVVFGNVGKIDEEGSIIAPSQGYKDFSLERLLAHNAGFPNASYPSTSAFLRRSLLLRTNFRFDEGLRTCPDFDMWLRLGMAARIGYIPLTLAYWREHSGSGSVRADFRSTVLESKRLALDNFFERSDLPSRIARRRSAAYAMLGIADRSAFLVSRGQLWQGTLSALRAIGGCPSVLLYPHMYGLLGRAFGIMLLRRLSLLEWARARRLNQRKA